MMDSHLTPLKPQSRFGDKPLKFQVVCPQNGTAVLKELMIYVDTLFLTYLHKYLTVLSGGRRITCTIYSRTCFLVWICTIQIIHSLS